KAAFIWTTATRAGVAWPPLLADDLGRVAAGCRAFCGVWPNIHQR
ncbi:MAG: Dethiobiotin synthetase, partial [Synechococcales cyanobacterium RM1_1_8]|nr:Dethiobiotin synthetase [Synechococcales cyanobacterium RM1_1_8]